jgi:hypothetical protein
LGERGGSAVDVLFAVGRIGQKQVELSSGGRHLGHGGEGVLNPNIHNRIRWPGRRRLCRQNVADARRRLRWNVRQYKCGNLSKDALLCRWNSWRGHAEQADCGALVEKVKRELRNALGATGT